MDKKPTQMDLENLMDIWRMGCRSDTKKEYENCKLCPSKKICKQVYNQLKDLIQQKPAVTKVAKQFVWNCSSDLAKQLDNIIPGSEAIDYTVILEEFLTWMLNRVGVETVENVHPIQEDK